MLSYVVSLCLNALEHAYKQRKVVAGCCKTLPCLLCYRSSQSCTTSWVKKVINSFSPSFVPAVP